MKKLILFVLFALSGLMVSAQSRWGITPEGGFAAVNRVGMGSSWRAGVKVGVGVSYQFEPGWIGLKSGLYYANRGYSLGDYPRTTESATYVLKEMMTGGITQHFLQLPVMADFSWKVSKEVRMHLAVGMYAGVSVKNDTNWGSSFTIGYSKEPQALGKYVKSTGLGYSYGYGHSGYDEAENADHPFRDVNSFDWGLTTSFGIEVNNWVMNLGYDLSLGDEGGNYKIDGDNFSLYEVRSVGANYNTMSLTVGYKFKL